MILKMPPEQPCLERFGLIYDTLPFCLSTTTAQSELGAIRADIKEPLTPKCELFCVLETSRCIMRALKHGGIALYTGWPLLLFLLDGLHHYPNVVSLCAITGRTVNTAVSGYTFPLPQRERRILFWLGAVEAHL